MAEQHRPGYELPLLLLAGFRAIVDDLHAALAEQGHPGARPMHGFVLQAIAGGAHTAVELGRALGVSKQAAGKTIDALVELGYLSRTTDPADGRRRLVELTGTGEDLLRRSAAIFEGIRDRWSERLGAERLAALEDDLRALVPAGGVQVDTPGWFGAAP
jgi:DNA-binding MarR family transcriptional regulator